MKLRLPRTTFSWILAILPRDQNPISYNAFSSRTEIYVGQAGTAEE